MLAKHSGPSFRRRRRCLLRVTYPSADYNWSGPYFVLNGGFGFGTSNWSLGGLSTGNFNVDGSLFGGTFGANFFQINGFVFGGEGDFDWSNIGGDRTETTNPAETGHYGFVPIVFLLTGRSHLERADVASASPST